MLSKPFETGMADEIADEFNHAELGDRRRNQRLSKVVTAMAKLPAASLAAASGGWAEVQATYRLLNCQDVTHEALLAPHQLAVAERCRAQGCVVVAQDTTEFDFSHMRELEGVGPLNDEDRKGFFMHSLHAVSEQGLPLGIVNMAITVRDVAKFSRRKIPHKQRASGDKESRRWVEGYLRTLELARSVPDCQVISVSDREGDIYEAFEAWHQAEDSDKPRAEWIIRANQDRALIGLVEDGEPPKLFATLAAAPLLGEASFEMKAKACLKKVKGSRVPRQRSARMVRQEIRALKITPRPPYRKGTKLPEVSFWAVLAQEVAPPEGEEPVCWLLLTSLEATTSEQALRILSLYQRRWAIEVFHRVLKTGCRVESIQLKTGQALINALAIYAVIAWRILYLTHLGRHCPELPCGCVFEEAEWKAACAVAKRKEAGEPTLAEFIGIVGKLGGHLGRKGDGPPGPQAIWQGLARIRDFACAWHALHGD
jgi:hypothetical protein